MLAGPEQDTKVAWEFQDSPVRGRVSNWISCGEEAKSHQTLGVGQAPACHFAQRAGKVVLMCRMMKLKLHATLHFELMHYPVKIDLDFMPPKPYYQTTMTMMKALTPHCMCPPYNHGDAVVE